jgi:ferredoxin
MFEIQNRLEHLNLYFLKIVSDYEFRYSNFSRYGVSSSYFHITVKLYVLFSRKYKLQRVFGLCGTLNHNMTKCARCGQCWRVCPQAAIEFQHLLVGQWDKVIILDLIPCRVCGEPLYSPAYRQKVESTLDSTQEALCPKHRQTHAASMWPQSVTGKTKQT